MLMARWLLSGFICYQLHIFFFLLENGNAQVKFYGYRRYCAFVAFPRRENQTLPALVQKPLKIANFFE